MSALLVHMEQFGKPLDPLLTPRFKRRVPRRRLEEIPAYMHPTERQPQALAPRILPTRQCVIRGVAVTHQDRTIRDVTKHRQRCVQVAMGVYMQQHRVWTQPDPQPTAFALAPFVPRLHPPTGLVAMQH